MKPASRIVLAALVASGIVVTGCDQDGLETAGRVTVRLVLQVTAEGAVGQVELSPHYRRTDQSRVSFDGTIVPLGAGSLNIPVDLDITGCLNDPRREQTGAGCPLRLAAVLRSDQGFTVDSVLAGPFDLVPNGQTTTPPIVLRAFGSVVLTPTVDTILPGGSRAIGLRVRDRQGGDLGVKPANWTSSAPNVASVSNTGVVTGIAPGVTTITAALSADTTVKATAAIVVRGVISFSITADSIIRPVADTVTPATTITAIGVTTALRWRSRNPNVATVDPQAGLVTVVSPGRAIVVAQPLADTTKADSLVIVGAGIVSVAVSPRTATIPLNATVSLVTTVVATGAASTAVTYTSTAPSVATVGATGIVTAVALGSATIRVQSVVDPTKRDSSLVTVVTAASNPSCANAAFPPLTINQSLRLLKANSPYRFTGSAVITAGAVLTVDPGVTVCAEPNTTLSFEQGGRLVARGTAADPIRFTSADAAIPWNGFRFADQPADSSVVTNALLERGSLGALTAWTGSHPVAYDSVRFRRWTGSALHLTRGRISRSTVDTVIGGEAAVYLGRGVTFEATTVRQADSIGLYAADTVRLLGGRVEQASVGLVNLLGSRPPAAYQPIRLTGNRGLPARLEVSWLARVARDSATQSFYLGNAIDAIATGGILTNDTVRVFGHLGLMVTLLGFGDNAVMFARPGARIEFIPDPAVNTQGSLSFFDGGKLESRGSFARPVVFTARNPAQPFEGISFLGQVFGPPVVPAGDTTRLTNTLVQFGGVTGSAVTFLTSGLPGVLDSTRVRQSAGVGLVVGFIRGTIFDTASGDQQVRIVRSRVDTSGTGNSGAVILLANSSMRNSVVRGARLKGIELGEGDLDSVTVTESGGDGVERVLINDSFEPISLQRSNLMNNAGAGFNNPFSLVPILLPDNWWGDPQGPFGPAGDGLTGAADPFPAALAPIGLITPFPAPPPASLAAATSSGVPRPRPLATTIGSLIQRLRAMVSRR